MTALPGWALERPGTIPMGAFSAMSLGDALRTVASATLASAARDIETGKADAHTVERLREAAQLLSGLGNEFVEKGRLAERAYSARQWVDQRMEEGRRNGDDG